MARTKGQTFCLMCENFARFERLAPAGHFIRCPGCGKRFERLRSDASADQLLDKLLLGTRKRAPQT